MKNILKIVVRTLATLIGRKNTAMCIRFLKSDMTDEEFKSAFGYHRELLQVPPGHFYSVFPDLDGVRQRKKEIFGPPAEGIPGISEHIEKQLALAEELAPLFQDFPYRFSPGENRVRGELNGKPLRFVSSEANKTFHLDAVILQAMLRHYKPNRVVEIGSGYSSATMLDTRERFGWSQQSLTFIEPFSQDYFFPLLREEDRHSINIIEKPVWDVEDSVFESLEAGDLLFIDSSHVAKIGSDVHHYLFRILPRLKPGVIIHIHDITAYFEMASPWFDCGWYWNEGAFLRAFLMYNRDFEIVFHTSLLLWEHKSAAGINTLRDHMENTFQLPETKWANSFYLKRVQAAERSQ